MIIRVIKKFIRNVFPEPHFTRMRNKKLYTWINKNAVGKRILNLGSGIGRFDKFLSQEIKTLNLDIDPLKPNINIVADAHFLPFKNDVIDFVYSIAVLEHVKRPWIVSDEIYRVLVRHGYVVLDLPFLNTIHNDHDYFRFTDEGIRSLFDEERFDCILEQVGSGGGSFLSVFLLFYFEQFIWSPIRPYIRFLFSYLCFPFKYLDVFIDKSKTLRLTANSFNFIGKKI
jgi:SAM-dependent methyltransferase